MKRFDIQQSVSTFAIIVCKAILVSMIATGGLYFAESAAAGDQEPFVADVYPTSSELLEFRTHGPHGISGTLDNWAYCVSEVALLNYATVHVIVSWNENTANKLPGAIWGAGGSWGFMEVVPVGWEGKGSFEGSFALSPAGWIGGKYDAELDYCKNGRIILQGKGVLSGLKIMFDHFNPPVYSDDGELVEILEIWKGYILSTER